MVEREKRKPLKCFRNDNGGEYTSNEFKNYCSKKGIRHEKIVPSTPQQNGVVERMNHIIVEKIRCMLRMANLPKSLWGEAVVTACYLINRSPLVSLDFDIPKRVWIEKDVSYFHLKVFGCKAFVHVPKEQRSKFDSKSTPCIFVGYGDAKFGYQLWDPKEKKMIVVFHENENLVEFEKTEKPKATVEVVPNLMPTSSSLDNATNREEIQDENYGDEPIEFDVDEPTSVDGDDVTNTDGVE